MAARKFLPLVSAALSLILLAGCGGNNSNAGPPQGNFTNASLSGAYAFAFSGTNLNSGAFFTMAGSFQANGSGMITSGMLDINSPGNGAVLTNLALTGTYIVHADGRGTATLTPPTSSTNPITIDFILLSSQHGAVIRFDNFASASGSLDLQDSSAFNLTTLAGNFAFNISGVDSNAAGAAAESSAGVFTVDTSGNLTTGVQDTTDNSTISANDALNAATAAMSAPANGRGTLSISSVGQPAARNFVYYVVNANQLNLIEVDSFPILAGAAFQQTSTAISGSFAFTVSGSSGGAPFAAGGILVTDGNGNVLNTSVEDVNNDGNVSTGVAISGTYAVAANGRGTLALSSANFAIYPSTGGIQALEIDGGAVASGTAFQQSGTFSNSTISGRYGANVTGVALPVTVFDAVYQLTADGNGNLTGAQDVNVAGSLATNLAFTGTAALGSNGRASAVGTLNTSAGNLGVIYYAVSSSRILFIEVDANPNGSVAVGALSQQQ